MAPVAGSESAAASVRIVKNTFLEFADNSHVMHQCSTQHRVRQCTDSCSDVKSTCNRSDLDQGLVSVWEVPTSDSLPSFAADAFSDSDDEDASSQAESCSSQVHHDLLPCPSELHARNRCVAQSCGTRELPAAPAMIIKNTFQVCMQLPQLAHSLHALHATPNEARCVVDLLGQQQRQDTRTPITPSLVRSRLRPSLRAPPKPLSTNCQAFSNESCPSLSMVLAKLRQKDPRRVLTLRKRHRLPAERAASLLHAHFRRLGPVDAIHIAHSKTKMDIHGAVRLQPSGVAFLVLRNVVDVETALQLGGTQLVGGVEIEIGRYKALDVERFESFLSC